MANFSKVADQRLMLVRFPKSAHVDEGLLFWLCSQFGEVQRMSKFTKKNNGWLYWNAAIVLFQDKADCQRAIEYLNQRVWGDVGILRCEHSINQDLKFSHNDHSNWDFSCVNKVLRDCEGRLNEVREELQRRCFEVMQHSESAHRGIVLPYVVVWKSLGQLEPSTPPQEVQYAVIWSGLPPDDVWQGGDCARAMLIINSMMGLAQRACRDAADPGTVRVKFETLAECERIVELMARQPLMLYGRQVTATCGRWSGSAGQKMKRTLPFFRGGSPHPPSSRLQLFDLSLDCTTTARDEKKIKKLFGSIPSGSTGGFIKVNCTVLPDIQGAIVQCASTEDAVLAACALNGDVDDELGVLHMLFLPDQSTDQFDPSAAAPPPSPVTRQMSYYRHDPYSATTEYFTSPLQSDYLTEGETDTPRSAAAEAAQHSSPRPLTSQIPTPTSALSHPSGISAPFLSGNSLAMSGPLTSVGPPTSVPSPTEIPFSSAACEVYVSEMPMIPVSASTVDLAPPMPASRTPSAPALVAMVPTPPGQYSPRLRQGTHPGPVLSLSFPAEYPPQYNYQQQYPPPYPADPRYEVLVRCSPPGHV